MSTTWEEIADQPAAWRRAAALASEAGDLLPAPGLRVCVVGCGTSLYMAQAWAALRERAGHGRTDAFAASELPGGRHYDTLVAISRSGTTSEVLHVLARGRGVATHSLAITAVADSPVADAADNALVLDFADERSVVQTRFATSALTLLRAHAGEDTERALRDAETALSAPLPVDPAPVEQWTFLGRGWAVGLAHEAALKLREAAQAWAEAYPALEYRHGPIAIAGPRTVVWSLDPLDAALADEVRSTGATLVCEALDPLAALVRAQRTAVSLAQARGLDPDRPRNLARSVVLEGAALEVLS
jgi:fructoselysine-6-P-deglycase FrlB-like protein